MTELIARPGIALVEIHGVSLLVADKEGRRTCPYVRQLNEIGAFIWKRIKEEKDCPEIVRSLRQEFDIPADCDLEADVEGFLQSLRESHYLVSEAEEHEV